ncbi:MAG: tRNA preQ1(34) S-adenosylmethionine ribosyltransferase-isomerase QueA [Deltaproteobacteria bacterium]|nr:MAG: tRNA preQ1(34) S-adenosylmethionine ribosyltransferase-isomerase QueA [Deltaproteobacteria bacterium]
MTRPLTVDDFQFELPAAAIAQVPAARREDARLMLLDRGGRAGPVDRRVRDLPALVRGDELLVMNDTRVVPARVKALKPSGGKVELLALGQAAAAGGRFVAMARSNKPLRPGQALVLADGACGPRVEASLGAGRYELSLPDGGDDLWGWLEAVGELPLPPYIERPAGPRPEDAERYQTVVARAPGAVAAPTAGLHFSQALLGALVGRGCEVISVTLHVGPGTFRPVRVERLDEHEMHAERYEICDAAAAAIAAARAAGRPVLAVGTTVVRTLEAAAAAHGGVVAAGSAETDIFIRPGFGFGVVDQLLTNFHLPGSTLLMLVSAFAGRERVLAAYGHALAAGYRFYSYGDGMLIR